MPRRKKENLETPIVGETKPRIVNPTLVKFLFLSLFLIPAIIVYSLSNKNSSKDIFVSSKNKTNSVFTKGLNSVILSNSGKLFYKRNAQEDWKQIYLAENINQYSVSSGTDIIVFKKDKEDIIYLINLKQDSEYKIISINEIISKYNLTGKNFNLCADNSIYLSDIGKRLAVLICDSESKIKHLGIIRLDANNAFTIVRKNLSGNILLFWLDENNLILNPDPLNKVRDIIFID